MTLDKVDVLKIDKDCHVAKDWIDAYLWLLLVTCQRYGVKVISLRKCPSRSKGLHFYIKIHPKIDAKLANYLQWLLGDDCRRIDFNRARIESSLNEWNKLFEAPGVRLRTIYRGEKAWQSRPPIRTNPRRTLPRTLRPISHSQTQAHTPSPLQPAAPRSP